MSTGADDVLRRAIDSTASSLSANDLSQRARSLLEDHLAALLKHERLLFNMPAVEPSTSIYPDISEAVRAAGEVSMRDVHLPPAPWYPDDSGEWVEVPDDQRGMPDNLCGTDPTEVLTASERKTKRFTSSYQQANGWDWDHAADAPARIVAYKVVRP